jgi:hypothetical protein
MTVDVWVWGQFAMAPGAELDWTFWIVDSNGNSVIDPEHWYWMSAVPDYDPDQHPDGPADATGVIFVEQGAFRPYQYPAGPNNTVWQASVKTASGVEEGISYFRPRMLVAPSL